MLPAGSADWQPLTLAAGVVTGVWPRVIGVVVYMCRFVTQAAADYVHRHSPVCNCPRVECHCGRRPCSMMVYLLFPLCALCTRRPGLYSRVTCPTFDTHADGCWWSIVVCSWRCECVTVAMHLPAVCACTPDPEAILHPICSRPNFASCLAEVASV